MSFLTVKQFAAKHPAFPESSLRWIIFNKEQNGFGPAILKAGRKVVIDEQKFFSCLNPQA